ncbi:MAG: AraC family transcriptional regulator [Prevotella sp.]|nr:AraC family transcriptional regulator [Prevotella sp.]
MYEYQGLQDIFFIMLYGAATFFALIACVYLLLRSGNAFAEDVRSSHVLRRWTAAFMAAIVGSHVWWVLLGQLFLTDDRLMRNIVAITLDRLTFVPLMMCVLVRMLQDRRRPLWPLILMFAPIAVVAVVCIITRSDIFEPAVEYYTVFLAVTFLIYYVHAVRQYGRWLLDNYADLERKEVWQSLLLLAFILFVHIAYSTNEGALFMEYLAQVNTLIIIAFLLWRVETLRSLTPLPSTERDVEDEDRSNIGQLLAKHCVDAKLYLQHDLTIAQLVAAIGVNRAYLSQYFSSQGINYNTYINGLRINHFISLYQEAVASRRPFTVQKLASESGYRSYSTFSLAFKQRMGQSVTAWMHNSAG